MHAVNLNLLLVVVVVVDCGLTSHSAIFQLYSDGTDVQFPNFDLLPGTHVMGNKGSLACRAYLDTGTGTSEDVFYLLAIRGPTRGEGKRGIEPGSSDPKSSPLPLRHRGGRPASCSFVKIPSAVIGKPNMCQKIKGQGDYRCWRIVILTFGLQIEIQREHARRGGQR